MFNNFKYYSTLVFFPLFLSSFAETQKPLQRPSMAYILQADKFDRNKNSAVNKLTASDRDLIVIDYSYSGDLDGKWTKQELTSIRQGKPGRKIVSYISIGEAEDYRPYWQAKWDANSDGVPDKVAPKFLNGLNPDWEGNYKVRYWQPEWQKIILTYISEIQEQGFDGIYLDIVDAFEFYEYDPQKKQWLDHRKNPETGNTYRQDMINWINTIAAHAREKDPQFLIIPQNGPQLLEDKSYLETISAIGIEDLYSNGKKLQKKDHFEYLNGFLKNLQNTEKAVYIIDYAKKEKLQKLVIDKAKKEKLSLLITDRNLTQIGETPLK